MEIFIGIIALVIAILTFKFSFFRKPTEELEHLKIQFKLTQKLSKEVQKNLASYIKLNDSSNEILFGDVTCGKYLAALQKAYEKYLPDKLLDDLDHLNMTKANITSMTQSIEKQFTALQNVQTFLEFKQ